MAFNNDDDRESASFNGFIFQHPTQQWSFDVDNSHSEHHSTDTREASPKSSVDQDTRSVNETPESAAAAAVDKHNTEPTKDTSSSLAFSLSQMHINSNPSFPPRDNTRLFKYHSRNERELQAFRRQRALDLQKKARENHKAYHPCLTNHISISDT